MSLAAPLPANVARSLLLRASTFDDLAPLGRVAVPPGKLFRRGERLVATGRLLQQISRMPMMVLGPLAGLSFVSVSVVSIFKSMLPLGIAVLVLSAFLAPGMLRRRAWLEEQVLLERGRAQLRESLRKRGADALQAWRKLVGEHLEAAAERLAGAMRAAVEATCKRETERFEQRRLRLSDQCRDLDAAIGKLDALRDECGKLRQRRLPECQRVIDVIGAIRGAAHMSTVVVSVGPDSIALASERLTRAVHAQGWCTRHGVLLCDREGRASGDGPSERDPVRGVATARCCVAAPGSSASPAHMAALECGRWPRALRWAAVLRCLADASGMDVDSAELKLGLDDEEAILDACRATSLLGWPLSNIAGQVPPAVAAVMSRWSERRPWCELRGADERVLIADSSSLPARARFGRCFMDPDEIAAVPVTACEFMMAGESLQVAGACDAELRGTHEYEISWRRMDR